MSKAITLENVKSYATEANLYKGIEKAGLNGVDCRYIVARTPEGRWTAIYMVSEYARAHGGYIGFAAQAGFMSV